MCGTDTWSSVLDWLAVKRVSSSLIPGLDEFRRTMRWRIRRGSGRPSQA